MNCPNCNNNLVYFNGEVVCEVCGEVLETHVFENPSHSFQREIIPVKGIITKTFNSKKGRKRKIGEYSVQELIQMAEENFQDDPIWREIIQNGGWPHVYKAAELIISDEQLKKRFDPKRVLKIATIAIAMSRGDKKIARIRELLGSREKMLLRKIQRINFKNGGGSNEDYIKDLCLIMKPKDEYKDISKIKIAEIVSECINRGLDIWSTLSIFYPETEIRKMGIHRYEYPLSAIVNNPRPISIKPHAQYYKVKISNFKLSNYIKKKTLKFTTCTLRLNSNSEAQIFLKKGYGIKDAVRELNNYGFKMSDIKPLQISYFIVFDSPVPDDVLDMVFERIREREWKFCNCIIQKTYDRKELGMKFRIVGLRDDNELHAIIERIIWGLNNYSKEALKQKIIELAYKIAHEKGRSPPKVKPEELKRALPYISYKDIRTVLMEIGAIPKRYSYENRTIIRWWFLPQAEMLVSEKTNSRCVTKSTNSALKSPQGSLGDTIYSLPLLQR